jgi:hypothetical protein
MIPRRVHTVHLTAPSDTLLRRGAVLLEDALHTASLPAAENSRLWLVRSLNLGKINSRNSAATIALTVEQQFRHLRLSAVHGSDPSAATASVVYFDDITDTYCCFALRLTQAPPISEWFWPLALPGWQPIWSRSIALKFALFGILQTPTKTMALVELLHRLRQAGRLDALLQTLEPSDGEALLQACGWSGTDLVSRSQIQSEQTAEYPSMDAASINTRMLIPWLLQWGSEDARSQWLAALCLLIDEPYRRSDPLLIQRAIDWIQLITSSAQSIELAQASPLNEIVLSNPFTQNKLGLTVENIAIESEIEQSEPSTASVTIGQSNAELTVECIESGDEIEQSNPDLEIIPGLNSTEGVVVSPSIGKVNYNTELIRSQPTNSSSQIIYCSSCTGFFGVVPLLNQLGLLQRCDRLPLDFPAHLLSYIAITFGIPDRDPIHQLLTSQDLNALFKGVTPMTEVTSDITAWVAAMRSWCRRYVGMTIAELVNRSGTFTLTPTHLDIFFQHDQADIRIRRSGLDLDPGWVPWLGRVVLFHYGNGE